MTNDQQRAVVKKGQHTWIQHGYVDLRHESIEMASASPALLSAGSSKEDAADVLLQALEFCIHDMEKYFDTPCGHVRVLREFLPHIVDKRQDARERYALFAVQTMKDPYEVWKVVYEAAGSNGTVEFVFERLAFIGLFDGRHQMLVAVDVRDGRTLWNFMQQDKKSLNKHRHGERIYAKCLNGMK